MCQHAFTTIHNRKSLCRPRRNGYVLVMCLFLIAVAGLLLASSARYGLGVSLDALDATSKFKSHWTRLSVRRAMLDRAEDLFELHELHFAVPTPVIHWEEQLSDCRLALSLMDEDAKVNVNTVVENADESELRRVLAKFSPRTSDWIAIRPMQLNAENLRPSLDSWGQIYALDGELEAGLTVEPLSLVQLDKVKKQFTCWGTGRLNVRRASQESLSVIADSVLDRGEEDRLVELRDQFPDASSSELIAKLGLRGETLQSLRYSLGDSSESYSLSIRNLDEPLNRIWNCDYVLPTHDGDEVYGYYFFGR